MKAQEYNMTQNKEVEYRIEKRPIAYYKVSVMSDRGHGRKICTVPISVDPLYPDEHRMDDVENGEHVIACVPAAPKSFEVFISSEVIRTGTQDVSIGLEIDGIYHRPWEEVCEEELKEWLK